MVKFTSITWEFWFAYLFHLGFDGVRHQQIKKNFSWLEKWFLSFSLLKKPKLRYSFTKTN
jgi:hypothetical protein